MALKQVIAGAARLQSNAKTVICANNKTSKFLLTNFLANQSLNMSKLSGTLAGNAHARLLSTTTKNYTNHKDGKTNNMETILVSRPAKYVAHLELNKPRSKNAFGFDTGFELIKHLDQLEQDSTCRIILLSGSGPDFTSGVDIKSFMSIYQQLQETEDIAKRAKLLWETIQKFQQPFKRMSKMIKPIIGIQHGLCLGLGMELAGSCDIRYCSRDTKYSIREVLIGIAADVGSLQLMPKLVNNQSLLNELIFTGRYITAEEALELGFVSKICETKEETLEKALEIAKIISSRSPVAIQGSKRNLKFSSDKSLEVGLDYNAIWNMAMMQGSDLVKAIGAILSKQQEDVDYDDF